MLAWFPALTYSLEMILVIIRAHLVIILFSHVYIIIVIQLGGLQGLGEMFTLKEILLSNSTTDGM